MKSANTRIDLFRFALRSSATPLNYKRGKQWQSFEKLARRLGCIHSRIEKKSSILWNSEKEVADYCRLEDGTKRLIKITFEPRFDIDVIDYFQITSGREISFPRNFQSLIKPIIRANPNSYLTVQVLDVEQTEISTPIINTEGTASIKTRIGQQKFRNDLIAYWSGCALCGLAFTDILKASHIKPWRDSSDNERLDSFNGLLLSPNHDSLFDKGYIAFDDEGRILLSSAARSQAEQLGLNDGMCLRKVDERHKKYLKKHREYFGFSVPN